METISTSPIYFKEVFTEHTWIGHIYPCWTITQFLDLIKPYILREFNTDDYEIVETGQQMMNGLPSESGIALTNSDIQLKEKWPNFSLVSFYVRRRNYVYPQLQNINLNLLNPVRGECPICLQDDIETFIRYNCSHRYCNVCYAGCQRIHYNMCSLCRS